MVEEEEAEAAGRGLGWARDGRELSEPDRRKERVEEVSRQEGKRSELEL